MRASRYNFTLDLQSQESQVCIISTLEDTNREFNISFSDGGEPIELEGNEAVMLYIDRPDGSTYESAEGVDKFVVTDENSRYYVKIPFKAEMFTTTGVYKFKLKIIEADDAKIHVWSPEFAMIVGEKKNK
jgi:hypothetical protein